MPSAFFQNLSRPDRATRADHPRRTGEAPIIRNTRELMLTFAR